MSRRSWILLLALASMWGASYLFIKLGLRDLSPAMVVFVRTLLGALALLPIAVRRGALRGLRGHIPAVVALAAVQVAAPFLLISYGERWIPSSLAGILVASAPIFTALLAPFLDSSQRANAWSLAGLAAGIGGVALLLGIDTGGGGLALVGALLVVLASAGYAIGGFMVKGRMGGYDPVGLVTSTMLASAALALPLALATAPDHLPGLGTVAAMAALGAGGTGLAFAIFYTLIQRDGPAKAAVVAYVAPGFAIAYGVVLLSEPFGAATLAGLVLILAGSWVAAEGRPPGRRRQPVKAPPEPAAVEAQRAA